MDKHSDDEIIRLILNADENNRNKAMQLLQEKYFKKCLPVIRKTIWNLTDSEYQSIFNDEMLTFCDKVIDGSFQYRAKISLLSYLKRGCVNKAHEYYRIYSNPRKNSDEIVGEYGIDDFNKEELNAELDFQDDKYARYGIELDFGEEDEEKERTRKEDIKLDEIIRVFQHLSEICKFIIILKFFAKLTHEEIADSLRFMYGIANSNVSRTYLNRCMDRMKEMVS